MKFIGLAGNGQLFVKMSAGMNAKELLEQS